MGCCSSDPPPAPDYVGAAQAQGQANKETAWANTIGANPNVTNPFGSQSVTYAPIWSNKKIVGYRPTITQKLSAAEQKQLNATQAIEGRLLDLAGTKGMNRISSLLSTSPPKANEDVRQQTIRALYKQQYSRLDPQWDQAKEAERNRLINTGFNEGSTGYNRAFGNFDRAKNDAYQTAWNNAILAGGNEQTRLYELESAARAAPVNELISLLSGTQIQTPQFQGFQGSNAAPADFAGAATNAGNWQTGVYNAQAAQSGANMGALGTLGAAAISACR